MEYHSYNAGGLACRLKCPPGRSNVPATAGLSHGKWEIDPTELTLLEELGKISSLHYVCTLVLTARPLSLPYLSPG